MKNDCEFRELLEHEIPRRGLSPQATQRFEDAYRTLGVQKEPEKKRGRGRRAWILSVSAVAACFVLLFSVNAAFPAFAESLPLIGSVFANFNGKSGKGVPGGINDRVIDRAVAVQPHSSSTVSAGAAVTKDPFDITISEASCDGMVLNLAFVIQCSDKELNEMDTTLFETVAGENPFVVTADGVRMECADSYVPFFTGTGEEGVYSGIVSYRIPDELGGKEELEISCRIPEFFVSSYPRGVTSTDKEQHVTLPVNWDTSFSLPVNANYQTYTPNASFGGVTLTKVTIGVSMLECDFILPADMDGRSILLPRDDRGERISVYDGAGGQNTDNGDGTKTYHMSFSAPELETSSLTFEIIQWPFEGDDPTVIGTYTLELD